MHRRTLLKTLAAAGLLQGAGISGLIREALANSSDPIQAGLRKLTGEVTINGRAAHEDMRIAPGDTVITGPGAEAVYVIGQDAFLQRADTEVIFGEDAAAFFRIVTGRLLSVFGHGAKRLMIPTAVVQRRAERAARGPSAEPLVGQQIYSRYDFFVRGAVGACSSSDCRYFRQP